MSRCLIVPKIVQFGASTLKTWAFECSRLAWVDIASEKLSCLFYR